MPLGNNAKSSRVEWGSGKRTHGRSKITVGDKPKAILAILFKWDAIYIYFGRERDHLYHSDAK